MYDDPLDGSPRRNNLALSLATGSDWRPILQASNQIVLYNPTSHALSIQRHGYSNPKHHSIIRSGGSCPYCHRRFSSSSLGNEGSSGIHLDDSSETHDLLDSRELEGGPTSARVANYFQLLQAANDAGSVPSTPRRSRSPSLVSVSDLGEGPKTFKPGTMAEGYFKAFFQEECRLGMGANGTVYLCQHVLDGNPLGHFAVKKIAVGQSHSYLLNILREVRLLEKLHHPNIITYHHAWLENCQFSSFGPKVPTLHVLMQWAEGGSLDDYIDIRLGRPPPAHIINHQHNHDLSNHKNAHNHHASSSSPSQPSSHLNAHPSSHTHITSNNGHYNNNHYNNHDRNHHNSNGAATSVQQEGPIQTRSGRIRAFRQMQKAPPEEKERIKRELAMSPGGGGANTWFPVHLLSAEEVKSLFEDVVNGLAFLHDKSILHLDLKPGNVLLTYDEGRLTPRAMLSDFGTSQDMLNSRTRSGNTGTLEYTSPESLPSPQTGLLSQIDSKSDMWSLGMILHKLLFLRLPYPSSSSPFSPFSNTSHPSKLNGRELADALEREVREYKGFKYTPSLVKSFEEGRRLPRAYLVLLEGLLSVNPTGRPSAERVREAVREGKLDPLPVKREEEEEEERKKSSLIPVRFGDGRGRPLGASHSSLNINHAQAQSQTRTRSRAQSRRRERDPIDHSSSSGFSERGYMYGHVSRVIFRRTVKSMILVGKVPSTTYPYLPLPTNVYTLTRTLALGLAIVDTWFDGFGISVLLGAVHWALLRVLSGWV
ncbi:kinase-like protein [Panus rudis PR-1116 ss-1]|nr:kinase-like protein [Panus rudis PR-1116 ss-1]